MDNKIEVVVDSEELFDFPGQICKYYHLGRQNQNFIERDFVDWVVLRAGQLYIKYVLEPESGHC